MRAKASPVQAAFDAQEQRPRPRRWTREEYYRAMDLGLFRPNERLELIRGEIIQKTAQKRPHARTISKSMQVLTTAFGAGCHVVSQLPMHLPGDSDPEPDVMVVKGSPDDYADHPTPDDVLLVVEVADTSLAYDREDKGALYAEGGVKEYWIINLRERVLEVFRDPAPMPNMPFGYGYLKSVVYTEMETVSPLTAPGASIHVADLLPLDNRPLRAVQ